MITCKICSKKYKDIRGLGIHISKIHHLPSKEYYDKFLKKDDEGICYCGKSTPYINMNNGYQKFCCLKCSQSSDYIKQKIKQTCIDKYGVESTNQLEFIKNKKIKTYQKKYRVDNPSQCDYIKKRFKQTIFNKYGVENPSQCDFVKEKKKRTSKLHYGVDYPSQCDNIKNKVRKTCNERYGVNNVFQLNDVKEKSKKTSLKKYGLEFPQKSSYMREICRKNIISSIENQKLNGEPLTPRIGNDERKCLDELQQYIDFEIKRNINIHGYFPDGYIKEINLVIEFDEEHHKYRYQKNKDELKDKDYKSYNLTVFRINKIEWIKNPEYIKQKFIHLKESKSYLNE